MREMSNEIRSEAANITPPAKLYLYDVDLTEQGGDVFRFFDGVNSKGEPVIWQGNAYTPYPMQGSDFGVKSNGTSPRPKLVFANVDGLITAINKQFDDALNAIVTRREVYETFLDAENFPDGNLQADPTQEVVSKFIIEHKESEDPDFVTYRLSLPAETDGALIPARTVQADICCWVYRSSDCGYTGPAVADDKDQPTNDPICDKCSKKFSGCLLRFPRPQPMSFGGFPGANKIR